MSDWLCQRASRTSLFTSRRNVARPNCAAPPSSSRGLIGFSSSARAMPGGGLRTSWRLGVGLRGSPPPSEGPRKREARGAVLGPPASRLLSCRMSPRGFALAARRPPSFQRSLTRPSISSRSSSSASRLSAINRAAAAMAMHTSRRSAHLRTPLDDSRALLFIGTHGRPPQT
jgi:hypothetical protein